MYDSILVPTDGSDTAESAAGHAVALADAFDARLHAVSVVDPDNRAGPFDAGGVDEEFLERAEADAAAAADSIAEFAGERPVETTVVRGSPAAAVTEYVAERGVDLVVMGTHGRTGISRVVTGSTSAQVVRESPVPVVTVRETDREQSAGYDAVLIPTDGSPAAEAAIDRGVAVADAFDATVHALYVVDTMTLAGGADATVPGGGGGGGVATGELLDPLLSRGEDATDLVAERARDAGVEVTTAVTEGSPGSTLLEYAEAESVDFVAMGTHGYTGIDRVLLGSTTERLIRNASVPVMSIRTDDVT